MAKVEPIENICVGSELPKLGNTQLLNGKISMTVSDFIHIIYVTYISRF